MIEWYEHEAKAECIDLRRQVAELERENERLRAKVTELSDEAYEYAEQVERLEGERDGARLAKARQEARGATLIQFMAILSREGDERAREWVTRSDNVAMSVRQEDLVRVQLNTAGGEGDE